jgi:prephenate dehydratase
VTAVNVSSATRAVFPGEPGSFAEDAVLAYCGPAAVPGQLATFRDVVEAVAAGTEAAGIVPIENVVFGTVREVYDLLADADVSIVGEVIVPVRLCLAALPGQPLESIERVYSHIQALGQAETFLRSRSWSLLTTYNTAAPASSSRMTRNRVPPPSCRPRRGRFGLSILAAEIQTVPDNRTRFLVVARPGVVGSVGPAAARSTPSADDRYRTTLVLAVNNEPGSLVRCLEISAARPQHWQARVTPEP